MDLWTTSGRHTAVLRLVEVGSGVRHSKTQETVYRSYKNIGFHVKGSAKR